MAAEHDQANWHWRRVGMTDNQLFANLALTLFTCGLWLPFAVFWYVVAWNQHGWVFDPRGPATPVPVAGPGVADRASAWMARRTVWQAAILAGGALTAIACAVVAVALFVTYPT